jgi:hypothetical protein
MRLVRLASVFALCVIAACGNHHTGSIGGTYDSIEVDPPVATLTIPIGGNVTQDYQVFGIIGNAKTDITANCTLTVDATFGAFSAATLTALSHGGKTNVLASCDDVTGSAELVINITGTIVIGGNTPANAAGLFGGATTGTDPSRVSAIEYPIDGAVSPRNIPPIEVQWTAAGNDLFHISLLSEFAAVDVYTSDLQATLAATDWEAIAASAAGDTLQISLEGLSQAAPQTKYAGTSASIAVSHDVIDRTAIYWWASSQGNIMSQTFGDTSAPTMVKGSCTSCHSVSRTATRIGYSRCINGQCGNLYAGFLRYDVPTGSWVEAVNADNMTIHGSFTTFAPRGNPFPDDSQSAAIVSMVDGTLALYDPDSGTPLASTISVANASGQSSMMADWSPDGTKVLYTHTPHANQWIDLSDGSIMIMDYTYSGGAHTFASPTQLVPNPLTLPNGTYTNFFFPSFSPDGQLVVFNAARSAWRDGNSAKGTGARLMLSQAAGAWYTDLTALNGGNVDMDITWAHWAPTESSDYYWIVFSSERDYGHEVTAANTNPTCRNVGVQQCKQIWIAAIARNKLTGTIDPSAAPMWVPGQDIQADNISPYWSVPAGLQ